MRIHGYLAFVAGICLTAWSCIQLLDAQQAHIRATFQHDTDKVASDTNVRLQTYFDMLLSIKGTFAINEHVSREQFARFVRELNLAERYPGFQAIQFVRLVRAGGVDSFSAAVRADTSIDPAGYPDFAVHPVVQRGAHYIIEYSEPFKGNENAFGLDLAGLAPHKAALELGRDSGKVVATERITLVQDKTGQPGFVARAPVYRQGMPLATLEQRRAALVGWVAIVFKVKHLMQEVIDPALMQQLTLAIYDTGNASEGATAPRDASTLMFESGQGRPGRLSGISAEKRLRVAQRQWVASFGALPGGRYSHDTSSVLWLAAGGVSISGLLAALLVASGRSRRLAAQLRVTLDEQRALQDSASVGIALLAHGSIVRCNRGMEEMMGYAPGELAGQPAALLAGPGAPASGLFALESASRHWQGELGLRRKDGSVIWCLIHGKAIEARALSQGAVWVIQDNSERKQSEAALLDAKDGLEASLGELARQKANVDSAQRELASVLATLKQAQTSLVTAEKMASLGALVAGTAHELNTPIGNSLLTATALDEMVAEFGRKYADGGVKRSALEGLMADTRQACGIMSSSLRRAAELVTSFRQVAVDQTSDRRRRFDLGDVVGDTMATFAAQLRHANCETVIDVPPGLLLDSYPGSVGQVLSNLINNALLHAFAGRPYASLSVTARVVEDELVQLIFADDGAGMPPKVLQQVFDPFFTTRMGQGGSGLGMSIVYTLVTGVLGGAISIVSDPERGTSVTIRIPRTAPGASRGETQSEGGDPVAAKTVVSLPD